MVDYASLLVTTVLGAAVLLSYYFVFRGETESYLGSRFWLGMPRGTTATLTVFQVLAAVGFVVAIGTWVFGEGPRGGVLGRNSLALPLTLGVMLAASAAWAPLTKMGLEDRSRTWAHALVVLSLVATAACSVVLVAGAAEENTVRPHVLAGLLVFASTTVLGDGVAWNARYIAASMK